MAQLIAQVCENVNPANHGQPGHFVLVSAISMGRSITSLTASAECHAKQRSPSPGALDPSPAGFGRRMTSPFRRSFLASSDFVGGVGDKDVPISCDDPEKCLHNGRVKLFAAAALQLAHDIAQRYAPVIRTIRRHRFDCIADTKYASFRRNHLPDQTIWIASTIPPLVMGAHKRRQVSERLAVLQELGA